MKWKPMHRSGNVCNHAVMWFAGIAVGASAAAQVPIVVATVPAEETAAAVVDPNL